MCQYVETIRLVDGQPRALPFHQARMERTLHQLHPTAPIPDLTSAVSQVAAGHGVWKCRVVYGSTGIVSVDATPYSLRRVESLKLVMADDIDYTYKTTDRSALLRLAALRDGADDVIIVRRGLLTDTSYTNIALKERDTGRWLTPRYPLLRGTMRERLLRTGQLTEADMDIADLPAFSDVALFNAMIDLGAVILKISAVAE